MFMDMKIFEIAVYVLLVVTLEFQFLILYLYIKDWRYWIRIPQFSALYFYGFIIAGGITSLIKKFRLFPE